MTAGAVRALQLDALPPIGSAVVAMGVFDGVHLGHQRLLAGVVGAARELGATPIALVFEPHPAEVLQPGTTVPRLTELAETARLIDAEGVRPVPIAFDAEMSRLPAAAFLDRLGPAIRLAALVMTRESAFGHRRDGTLRRAGQIGRERGFGVRIVPLKEVDRAPVSSTRVRAAVTRAELETAARLMGRPLVLIGDLIGRGPGEIELSMPYEAALPPPGRYVAHVQPIDGRGPAGDVVLEVGEGPPRLVVAGAPTATSDGPARVAVHGGAD